MIELSGPLRADQSPAPGRLHDEFRQTAAINDSEGRTLTWIKKRLAAGVDIDAPDANGVTALMMAARGRAPWRLEALLEAGANPLLRDGEGRTARDIALLVDAPWLAMRLAYAEAEASAPRRGKAKAAIEPQADAIEETAQIAEGGEWSPRGLNAFVSRTLNEADARAVIRARPKNPLPLAELEALGRHWRNDALHAAAGLGNLPWTRALLDAGATADDGMETCAPLNRAVLAGSMSCIKALLAAGADPAARDDLGFNAMLLAAKLGNVAAFDVFRRKFPTRELASEDLVALAGMATENGHSAFARELLAKADPATYRESDSPYGAEALVNAIEADDMSMLKAFLGWGATPHPSYDMAPYQPFVHAARLGRVRMLPPLFARLDELDTLSPPTPLDLALGAARSRGQRKAVEWLLAKGAKESGFYSSLALYPRLYGAGAAKLMLEGGAKKNDKTVPLLVEGNVWQALQWIEGRERRAWPRGRREDPTGERVIPPEGSGERAGSKILAVEAAEREIVELLAATSPAGWTRAAARVAAKLFGIRAGVLKGDPELVFVAAERDSAALLAHLGAGDLAMPDGSHPLAAIDEAGCSLLHRAALSGADRAACALLDAMAALPREPRRAVTAAFRFRDYAHRLPMHWAALSGCGEAMARLLAQRPADAFAKDAAGKDPWTLSVEAPADAGAAAVAALVHATDQSGGVVPEGLLTLCIGRLGAQQKFDDDIHDERIAHVVNEAAYARLAALLRMNGASQEPAKTRGRRAKELVAAAKAYAASCGWKSEGHRIVDLLARRLRNGEAAGAGADAENLDLALWTCAGDEDNPAEIERLLGQGAVLMEHRERTPLQRAIWRGQAGNIKFLFGLEKLKGKRRDEFLFASVEQAMRAEEPASVGALLELGASPDAIATKADNKSLLSVAVAEKQPDMARALLAGGADVNGVAGEKLAPLVHAILGAHLELVDILVEAGADMAAPFSDAPTGLFVAVHSVRLDPARDEQAAQVVARLLQGGADDSIRNANGITALEWAQSDLDASSITSQVLKAKSEERQMAEVVGLTAEPAPAPVATRSRARAL